MAAAKPLKDLISDDFLTCKICLEAFHKPKVLSCQHSFCEACLEGHIKKMYAEKTSFNCPECRADIAIPKGGVSELKNNFFILSLQDALATSAAVSEDKNASLCESCENEGEDLQFCIECDQNLCQSCSKQHERLKCSKDHHLLPIKDISEGKCADILRANQRTYCLHHTKNTVEFYCEKCEKALCISCFVTEHNQHKCQHIKQAADKLRADLRTGNESTNKLETDIKTGIDNIQDLQKKADTEAKKLIAQIQSKERTVIEQVKAHSSQLQQEIESTLSNDTKQLTLLLEDFEFHKTGLESAKSFANSMLDVGNDGETVAMVPDCIKQFSRLSIQVLPEIPLITKVLQAKFTNTIYPCNDWFGNIIYNEDGKPSTESNCQSTESCHQQSSFITQKSTQETVDYVNKPWTDDDALYLIDTMWFDTWLQHKNGGQNPGPITTSRLGKYIIEEGLTLNNDFLIIQEPLWKELSGKYGLEPVKQPVICQSPKLVAKERYLEINHRRHYLLEHVELILE